MPAEVARLLGVTALRTINRMAHNPNMQPEGVGADVDALVLLDWPSEVDDIAGKHCNGQIGYQYRLRIDRQHTRVAYDYLCRTRPPEERDATLTEIEAHRPDIEGTIAACRPLVVYALGHRVVDWLSAGIGYSISTHRGRVFAARVAGCSFWVVPVIPPRQAERMFETGDKRGSGDDLRKHTWKDLKREGVRGKTWAELGRPGVLPANKAKLLTRYGCKIVTTCSPAALLEFSTSAKRTIEFDFETTCKRPYAKGAAITSIAVSDGKQTLSMLVDHPDCPVPARVLDELRDVFVELFRGRRVYAHNLQFDLEWLLWFVGPERARVILQGIHQWCCSDVGAFIIDQREGKSLDYLCRMYFGLPFKNLSPHESWDKRGTPSGVQELLEYGALDAAIGYAVAGVQRMELTRLGRIDQFNYHMQRVPMLVAMQARGFPIDEPTVQRFDDEYTDRQAKLLAAIADDKHVKQYVATTGPFMPSSPDCVLRLFHDQLRCKEVRRDDKLTTDAEALGAIKGHLPIAGLILDLREVEKKLGTYVRRFHIGTAKSYVYPDGKLHSEFPTTRTATRRLASMHPNAQNWPKRKGKEIRAVVRVPDGWVIVSIDLGQIEARCLAMESQDPNVIRQFTDSSYDIHMEWAIKLADACPAVMRNYSGIEHFRSAVKNEFVFPAFYGAGVKKIARLTGIPERILHPLFAEFWGQFKGVKKWQKRQLELYEARGYVESLLGYRRYGPLKYNMILNTGPQSLGSDICVEAAVRMHQHALETGEDFFQPIGNIHDDLLYVVPKSELAWFTPIAVRNTIVSPHPFVSVVPLTCDLEQGQDWAHMERVASFRSDQLPA
jgi:uracil-DNA glycosylase family 4